VSSVLRISGRKTGTQPGGDRGRVQMIMRRDSHTADLVSSARPRVAHSVVEGDGVRQDVDDPSSREVCEFVDAQSRTAGF